MSEECNCWIRHANTPEHRAQISAQLEYFRRIGDSTGTMVAMAQLAGPCPARGAGNTQITSAK